MVVGAENLSNGFRSLASGAYDVHQQVERMTWLRPRFCGRCRPYAGIWGKSTSTSVHLIAEMTIMIMIMIWVVNCKICVRLMIDFRLVWQSLPYLYQSSRETWFTIIANKKYRNTDDCFNFYLSSDTSFISESNNVIFVLFSLGTLFLTYCCIDRYVV